MLYSYCNFTESVKSGTIFYKSKLPCHKILTIIYLWLIKTPIIFSSIAAGINKDTADKLFKTFRRMVEDCLEESDTVIGGPDIIVAIDESKESIIEDKMLKVLGWRRY